MDKFHRLEKEGFATLFPREETVKEDWHALYLRMELTDAMGAIRFRLLLPPTSR